MNDKFKTSIILAMPRVITVQPLHFLNRKAVFSVDLSINVYRWYETRVKTIPALGAISLYLLSFHTKATVIYGFNTLHLQ